MKNKNISYSFFILVFIFSSCNKKNEVPSQEVPISLPQNINLLDKPLTDIRNIIFGKWQIKRTHTEVTGVVGISIRDSIYQNNSGDVINFLKKDTVHHLDNTQLQTKLFDRANVTKMKSWYGSYNGFPYNVDSIFVYNFPINTFYTITMVEIKNDTLVTYGPRPFTTTFLIRVP